MASPDPFESTSAPHNFPEDLANVNKELVAHLEKYWIGDKSCPICGHVKWVLGDLGEFRSFTGAEPWGVLEAKRITPIAQISCGRCGFVHLFNAITAGLVFGDQPDPNGADE